MFLTLNSTCIQNLTWTMSRKYSMQQGERIKNKSRDVILYIKHLLSEQGVYTRKWYVSLLWLFLRKLRVCGTNTRTLCSMNVRQIIQLFFAIEPCNIESYIFNLNINCKIWKSPLISSVFSINFVYLNLVVNLV